MDAFWRIEFWQFREPGMDIAQGITQITRLSVLEQMCIVFTALCQVAMIDAPVTRV